MILSGLVSHFSYWKSHREKFGLFTAYTMQLPTKDVAREQRLLKVINCGEKNV